jgi:ketosteroid isomerase-like protein
MRGIWVRVVCIPIIIACAGSDSKTAETSRQVAAASVRGALDSFFEAAGAKNWESIGAMLAPDFEFYTDDAIVLDRAGFLKAMQEDSMDVQKLQLSDVKVELSPDELLAWVKYRILLQSSIKGKPYNVATAETVVFRKDGGKWQMTHNHASIKKAP